MDKSTDSFFNYSRTIAADFLTTALIIDDQAKLGIREDIEKPVEKLAPVKERKTVVRKKSSSQEVTHEEESKEELSQREAPPSRFLNAKKVIESFAENRIICSVIKPLESDKHTITGLVKKLSQSADLIVIDWDLFEGSGKATLEIIKEIISSNIDPDHYRLRLISIYTGEPNLENIYEEIKQVFNDFDLNKIFDDNNLKMSIAASRIIVLAKEETAVNEQFREKVVTFHDLPSRLIDEFTEITFGLLSNVVMDSFSKIRQNTYKILVKFSSDIDAPYLTHRVCLPHPEDSENFVESIVSKEIESLLREYSVGQRVNLDVLLKWIKYQIVSGKTYAFNGEKFNEEKLIDLLKRGVVSEKNNISKDNGFKTLTKFFSIKSDAESEKLDLTFSKMIIMQSQYSGSTPSLTLGSILKQKTGEDAGKIWVCIQPRCDSVRINEENGRGFPFLPLTDPSSKNSIHIVTNPETDRLKRLMLSIKPYNCKLINFLPDKTCKKVLANKVSDNFQFVDTATPPTEYEWLGELKPEFAQNIANTFGAELSRVGLDNFEWLRRWEEKGQK